MKHPSRNGALQRRSALLHVLRYSLALHCSALAMVPPGVAVASPNAAARSTLLVVGDSLSAEFGLPRGAGWVALLEQRLALERKGWEVTNASISGDTSAGGRSRLPSLLKLHTPQVVIIELGGNDALRGLPLASTRENLLAMVKAAQAAGARVLLLGMQVPPNYGPQYTRDFAACYVQVAQATRAALLPFLLRGVADRPDAEDWFQADRIHPKAQAHPLILDNVWGVLKPLLN